MNDASHRYLSAARAISQELDERGFSTEDSSKTDGLVEKMAEIIQQEIEGNVNWEVVGEEQNDPDEIALNTLLRNLTVNEIDGLEGDLTNQL
jgi:hypothetical protein